MRAHIVSIAGFEPLSRSIVGKGAGPVYSAVAVAWTIALIGVAARHLTIAVDEFAMAAAINVRRSALAFACRAGDSIGSQRWCRGAACSWRGASA